ncbi:hypothetical protein [Streptomyces sp. NPDC001480]|uniref:hypothetical protein n=1 Tax=Streptomyces sp. NPDC001480 TaxID=3364577 RepID=UPI0036D17E79
MSQAMEYRRHRHPGLVTFQWTVEDADGEPELIAVGDCPVCTCKMTRSFGPVQPLIAKGGFLGRRQGPGTEPWTTTCRCESYHQPRPAGAHGCGALLTIAPPPSGLTGEN